MAQLIHINALWKVPADLKCDYGEKQVPQKMMILISILKVFRNFQFEWKESVSCVLKNI
jgi:hypothetical protein